MSGHIHLIGAANQGIMFRPIDIAGCPCWLRGDLGMSLAGGKITKWGDQSGLGNDATGVTGAAGIGPLQILGALHGHPGVRLDGGSGGGQGDYFTFASSFLTHPCTVFFVVNNTYEINVGTLFSQFSGILYMLKVDSAPYLGVYRNGYVSSAFIIDSNYKIISFREANYNNIIINVGASTQTLTTGTGYYLNFSNSLGSDPARQSCGMTILEFFCYNSILCTDDMAKVNGYLSSRYGLPT